MRNFNFHRIKEVFACTHYDDNQVKNSRDIAMSYTVIKRAVTYFCSKYDIKKYQKRCFPAL